MWVRPPTLVALAAFAFGPGAAATSYVYQQPVELTNAQATLLQVGEGQPGDAGSVPFAILVENVGSWKTPASQPPQTLRIQSARESWASDPGPSHIGQYCATHVAQILTIESLGPAYRHVFRWTMRFWSQPVPSGSRLTLTRPPLHEDDAIFVAYVVRGSPHYFAPGDLISLFGRLTYPEAVDHPVTGRRVVAPALVAHRPMGGVRDMFSRRRREPMGPAQVCEALLVFAGVGVLASVALGAALHLRRRRSHAALDGSRIRALAPWWRITPRTALPAVLRRVRVVRGLIFLSLGTTTTVAMAWWLAATPPFMSLQGSYQGYYIDDGNLLWIYTANSQGGKRFGTLRPRLRWLQSQFRTRPSDTLFEQLETMPLPSKPRFTLTRGIGDLGKRLEGLDIGDYSLSSGYRNGPDALWRQDKEFGCPMLALRRYSIYQMNEQTGSWSVSEGGTMVVDSTPGQRRVVPLIPVFPGFLVNVAFYALLWFAPFYGATMIRRTRRRRRGHCPLCNYDLDHALSAGCPECGWNKVASDSRVVSLKR